MPPDPPTPRNPTSGGGLEVAEPTWLHAGAPPARNRRGRRAPERSVSGAGPTSCSGPSSRGSRSGVEDRSARAVIPAHRVRWRDSVGWQVAVALLAVAAGVVAVWVTLPADFLRYPAWLAAQKADFVIGPALTGMYWIRRRPQSPFGPMLIGWGFVGALYILQSSSDELAVHDRPVLGEGLRAGHLRAHPGLPHRALGPPVEDPAGRRRRHACS